MDFIPQQFISQEEKGKVFFIFFFFGQLVIFATFVKKFAYQACLHIPNRTLKYEYMKSSQS